MENKCCWAPTDTYAPGLTFSLRHKGDRTLYAITNVGSEFTMNGRFTARTELINSIFSHFNADSIEPHRDVVFSNVSGNRTVKIHRSIQCHKNAVMGKEI